jgi:hypothetical protein
MERKKNDSNSFMNTHYFETICNGEKMWLLVHSVSSV